MLEKRIWTTPCPIESACRATNRGNALRTAKRIYRQEWQLRSDKEKQGRLWDAHWGGCVRALRRIFKDEFPTKKWRGLWIEWPTTDWSMNGITKEVELRMHYRAHWFGMFFERTFLVAQREDVVADARRLAGVLLKWDDAK